MGAELASVLGIVAEADAGVEVVGVEVVPAAVLATCPEKVFALTSL